MTVCTEDGCFPVHPVVCLAIRACMFVGECVSVGFSVCVCMYVFVCVCVCLSVLVLSVYVCLCLSVFSHSLVSGIMYLCEPECVLSYYTYRLTTKRELS